MHEITSRYPFYTNYTNFKSIIDSYIPSGNITDQNHLEISRFNASIIYKLQTMIFSLEKLKEIVQNQIYIHQLTSTAPPTTQQQTTQQQTPEEFNDYYQLRLYQDQLFYSIIGTLDFLSLEINLIYSSPIPNPRGCNFINLNNLFRSRGLTGPIQTRLDAIYNDPWYQEIVPFRHCHTHRYLPDFQLIMLVQEGNQPVPAIILPDDPLTLPHTFNFNREIIPFCQNKVDSCIRDINSLYGDLVTVTNQHGQIPY